MIDHALRFTVPQHLRRPHLPGPPRRRLGQLTDGAADGLRVRLKASFDLSKLSPQARVIGQALKTYGMILADNGSAWYVSGFSSAGFNDDDLRTLNQITGDNLEVVNTAKLVNG